ncbi:MAG: MFS transporter [Anaerolineae bacterium]|nr:MFS transporter [Anaerolineae bacterium]
MDTPVTRKELPWLTKVIYGTGDWGVATFNTMRQIFYAIFLTDVVGLEPRLASFAALIGVLWDAVNDPLVGTISDKVRSKWGRRRPFLLYFAVPYGLAFLMLWWTPPWKSQIWLMIHVMLAYALSDTFQTLVIVPFHALTPEITSDYDERTSLAGYRMFFNFIASIVTAVAAPMIVDATMTGGGTQQQGYVIVATLFGVSAIIPYLLIFFAVREKSSSEHPPEMVSFSDTLRTAWQNIPFRYATALYMLNWVTFDLVGVTLPYFLIYWIARGNLLATVPGIGMPIESVVLGAMLITAVIVLPFWTWLAYRIGKHKAYIIAIGFWVILMLLINFIPPLEYTLVIVMAVLIGISVSAAHVLPDAIFPDVIDWDELRTGARHEGIYYGAKNFIRKLTTAFAIFIALQVLGWLGYQVPPEGATQFTQPESAILGIRILTGPVAAAILCGVLAVTWYYPLDRQRHKRVLRLLARRQAREARRQAAIATVQTTVD